MLSHVLFCHYVFGWMSAGVLGLDVVTVVKLILLLTIGSFQPYGEEDESCTCSWCVGYERIRLVMVCVW